jgi:hypothetical protein
MLTTLAQFRQQARERTQMVKSRLVSETELATYINASIKELYDILVSRFEDYYLKDALAVISFGSDQIARRFLQVEGCGF